MHRSKAEIIERMNEIGITHRVCMGNCPIKRAEHSAEIDVPLRKIPFILISNDNAGVREDWWQDEVYIEELDVNGASYERLQTFFTDHEPSVDNAIGRIDNTRVEDGKLKADVIFGSDERANAIFEKYKDGILTDVSIGYKIIDVKLTRGKDSNPDHVLVTDYEVVELSAVWRGFDSGASIGRAEKTETNDEKSNQTPEMDGRCVDVLERELKLKGKTV